MTNSQTSWCYNIVSSDALVLRLASLADCLQKTKMSNCSVLEFEIKCKSLLSIKFRIYLISISRQKANKQLDI